jgi:uncharacterized protein
MAFSPDPDGVRIAVRLTPKAGRNRIGGFVEDAEGKAALKVAVTAVPEKGRANKALIELLAKTWRVPKTTIELIAGSKDRNKVVRISGETKALLADLRDWAEQIETEEKDK